MRFWPIRVPIAVLVLAVLCLATARQLSQLVDHVMTIRVARLSGPALAAEPRASVHRLWSPRPSSCQIQVKS